MTSTVTEDDSAPTFTVTFECRNCGCEWSNTYPSKTRVGRGKVDTGRVRVTDKTCNDFACDCCSVVTCPVCELRDHVIVDDREPVGGDE